MVTFDYASKIATLLAKAESSAFDAEAELLRNKAQELMIKWGIDDAMVADAGTEKPEPIVRKNIAIVNQYHMGLYMMGQAVAEAMGGLKAFIIRVDSNKHTVIVVVGHESDVARFATLFASLRLQADSAMRQWWKAERKENGWLYNDNTAWTARRQFIISFGNGVAAILREQKSDLVERGSSTELVLVSRTAKVEGWVDGNMKIGADRSRGMDSGSWSAVQNGFRAGQRAATTPVSKGQIG